MLELTSTFRDILKKSESGNWRYIVKIEQTANDHINMLTDGGLNIAGADPPVMQGWTNGGEATQIERETTLQHYQDSCVKLTRTTALGSAWISQTFVTVASTDYVATFYARGDGTNAGRYNIQDVSNAGFLITERSTGVSGTAWQKVVVPFSTIGGGISTAIVTVSNITVDNSFCFIDDVHVQPASDYYYYSGQEFEIVDLTANDIVRGVLKSKDIPIIQLLDWREHKASVGGFSIQLADDGLNDAWASNPIFNRRIWLYLGTDDLSYLDDYQLLYTGLCKNWTTVNGTITLNIENSSLISQKEIPVLLSDSDAAAGQSGILPDDSKGKVKTLILGDHEYHFMRETEAGGDGTDTTYDRGSNLTPCRFLGMDQDGDERWLVSANAVETIQADRAIWAFDPSLNRMVELATVVVEQNTSAGCIISFTPNPDLYDYWLPDGSISNEADDDQGGTAEVTDPTKMCDLDNTTFGYFDVISGENGGPPSYSLDIDFPDYENAGTISGVAVFAYAHFHTDGGGVRAMTINAVDATGANNTFAAYGADAATIAGATLAVPVKAEADNGVGAEQHIFEVMMVYKRITYKANNRLQIYAGVKGREYSGTWNGRKTSGNLIETAADVIESIARDDLGLDDDSIDMDSFDAVNTELGATFVFSGAITERENSKVILEDLARQCKSFVFWGADDKVKMDTFFAANTTIRKLGSNEIDGLPIITQSKLSDIVNDLTLTYKKEPIQKSLIKTLSRVDDRTAAAGSQTRYNAVMTKDLEADFIRDDTAAGLFVDHWCKNDADSFWSVKHDVIEFSISANRGINYWDTTFKPLFLLEQLDIIELDDADFDPILLCNGVSWDGKQFKIFWIERRKLGLRIKGFSV